MKRTAVIMAGGSGERFYPLSRRTRPKQLIPLVHATKTMIEESIERIDGVIDPADIFIITSEVLQPAIRNVVRNVPPQNVIAEPRKRNTAPCLALAAAVFASRYGDTSEISVAVVTADQFIADVDVFRDQVRASLEYAESHPVLVTLGITPSRAETGYGYIESGNARTDGFYDVKSFREKPDRATAEQFLDSGAFLWNSGMFFFRCDTFVDGLLLHEPAVGASVEALRTAIGPSSMAAADGAFEGIDDVFASLPDISIDYALMERATNVVVLPSRFQWDDVGSWDSLDRTNAHDDAGNVSIGTTTLVDTHDAIVANYSSGGAMMVSVIGMDNVVVIATDDSVVVVPKDRVQEVKKAVTLMRDRGQESWL